MSIDGEHPGCRRAARRGSGAPPRSGRAGRILVFMLVATGGLTTVGCSDRGPTAPDGVEEVGEGVGRANTDDLPARLRRLAEERGVTPLPPSPRVRGSLARLGRMLMFDKILSGNRDISCMTCHLPSLGTGDGRSLAIGQGGTGIGPDRVHPAGVFIPRNAPPLFNLHLLDHLFWDGRVEGDGAGGVHTPAGSALAPAMETAFEFGPLSAIGLFPVLSRDEMRGELGENELAAVPDGDPEEIWSALMHRLGAIPAYRRMFEAAYPLTAFRDMSFAHASNAMAGFLLTAFVFDNSPWDRFLAGSDPALSREQLAGALKFMNAPCVQCHNGPGFSDDAFHNVALAQFGPGTGNGPSGRDDFGRMNVTGESGDLYRFRTTMLRNVELTAPYGHAGQFQRLGDFIDHYSRSDEKLRAYSDSDIPDPKLRGTLLSGNGERIIETRDPLILGVEFDENFTRQVTAFMLALTDERARRLGRLVPRRVPSGLDVDR